MKKHNYHFLLISLIVFLFFLSSTILVIAIGSEPICVEVCSGGGGVAEGAYCDFNGTCCCPPFSCIGLSCSSGCEAEAGVCNFNCGKDDMCCFPLSLTQLLHLTLVF